MFLASRLYYLSDERDSSLEYGWVALSEALDHSLQWGIGFEKSSWHGPDCFPGLSCFHCWTICWIDSHLPGFWKTLPTYGIDCTCSHLHDFCVGCLNWDHEICVQPII